MEKKLENKKIRQGLYILEVFLVIFQVFTIVLAQSKKYYLIHDWIFYVVNYIIVILPFVITIKNKKLMMLKVIVGIVLLVINTSFFLNLGCVKLVISKSENKKHELILKEYEKMNYETVRLKRRGLIYGRVSDTISGSSKYKTLDKETYNIDWVSGDTAVFTYIANDKKVLKENIFNFRDTDTLSYYYVLPTLGGKWIENDNKNNYFMHDGSDIIYANNGKLYYYDINSVTQYGVWSIVLKGDEEKPTIAVILNSDCKIGTNGLIEEDGSISIKHIEVNDTESKVFNRE